MTNREFKPSSWAIDNKTSIFILTIIITIAGLAAYINLPKESFPDIVVPTITVSTVYPGTSPANIENLVTRPLEKQIKAISGVKKLTSNSMQDFSIVMVEFSTDMNVQEAKLKVKDAVDKARTELPNDLPRDPNIMEVNFSEFPIMYINISGDYDLNKLKKYSDMLKDRIETMKEITRVDLVGALTREIQINVDMYKMQSARLTLGDIERAVGYENLTISGGTVKMDGVRRSVSLKKQFVSADEISNLVIQSMAGASIYLKDIAEVKDTQKEQESFARLNGKNVITLNVVKRSGENLIEASDKIRAIISEFQKTKFPQGLDIVITGDQSDQTRLTLHDMINTIVIGFVLVTIILMFFMGTTNAIFVAMSVPLSCFIAFLIMPGIGFTLNMIVLFSFLLALGIVVDDAIVVIENTHRIFDNGKMDIKKAAKLATGEVFLPVLSGTLTTLAPFIPLAFWSGIMGKFMFFLPITLIITLMASLAVAYIINPVFAVAFMKSHANENDHEHKRKSKKSTLIVSIIFGSVAILSYLSASFGFGNFVVLLLLLYLLNKYVLSKWINKFQTKVWPNVQNKYAVALGWALERPKTMLFGTIVLLFASVFLIIERSPNVIFFPVSDPNFIYVYVALPIGTDQAYTNEVVKVVEEKVNHVLGTNNPIVSSVISNVTIGVSDPSEDDQGSYSNKGRVAISFVQFSQRNGESTTDYLDKIRAAVKDIPGAQITVAQEQNGPPVPKPISIEVSGDDIDVLAISAAKLKYYLDSINISGVEELKSDFQNNKPEIVFDLDRERANREGITSGQIGMEIRTAVFGKEVSKFRDENDEYPIMLRYKEDQRNNIEALKNLKITYRDMAMGGEIRDVPISAFADIKYENTYGGIRRKAQKRVITISSNVLGDFNPNEVVANIQSYIDTYPKEEGVSIIMAGEQEEQKETLSFLGNALLISLAIMFLILVTQFNSFSKPIIILSEILFSIIGVLLGIAIFKMDLSIVMCGVGIVSLGGIVVRNGILIVEFIEVLRARGKPLFEAIVEAGKIRMTPVILTASATILGLIPLAVGFNIDFVRLFAELNPHIYFGGDSTAFWGPLSWTMIFGLGFATFLTLILVPVMYLLAEKAKMKIGLGGNP
jgi:multidrug efflux pump subunit AcrB